MGSEQIVARFTELGHDIDEAEATSRMDTLTGQFKVPEADAMSSVVAYFLRKLGVERSDYYKGMGTTQSSTIADIPVEEDKWVNLRVKLTDIWDSDHETIQQTGLLGDETGKIKFTLWSSAGLPDMELNKVYSIDSVVTKVWNDRVSINMNKASKITEIEDEIEVGHTDVEFTGVLVAIKPNSGLIKRCTECNRALKSGTCSEHGANEGTYDLRIMGVLDDGRETKDILLGKELSESIWGHTMDEAMQMATSSLDAGVVLDDMMNTLVGKYYKVEGGQMESMIFVRTYEVI